jgi:hypothetical protein
VSRPSVDRFVTGAGLVVTIAALSIGTARYGGPDEPAHVVRAHAVAHGDLRGDPVPTMPPGFRAVTVPRSLASGDPACYRFDRDVPADCAVAVDDATPTIVATAAGVNPPWYYAAVGVIARAISGVSGQISVGTMRAGAVILHAAALLLAIGRCRSRHVSAVAAIVVTPAAVPLFAVVNPNALEIALVLVAIAGITRATTARRTSDAWWIGVPLGLAVLCRPIAIVAAAAVLASGVAVIGRSQVRRPAMFIGLLAPIVVAIAATIGWQWWLGAALRDQRTAVTDTWTTALLDAVAGVPSTIVESIGSLGWNEYRIPPIAWIAWTAAAGIVVWRWGFARRCAGEAPRSISARTTAVTIGTVVAVAVIVAPVAFEVIARSWVGPIWQGRYSIASLLPLALVPLALVPLALVPQASTGMRQPSRGVVALVAVAGITTGWQVVRRGAVGLSGPWWPGGPRSTVSLVLLAVGWAAIAFASIRREPPSSSRRSNQAQIT